MSNRLFAAYGVGINRAEMAMLCPPDVEKKLFITPGSVYNT